MKQLILLLITLLAFNLQAQRLKIDPYKITKGKAIGWGVTVIAGAFDGVLEGYTFDGRGSFERKYNVSKTGYFGSESWRNVYNGGEPANGFKSHFHKQIGAFDFYHHADDVRKFGYISGGCIIGISGAKKNTQVWHYVADFAVSFGLSAMSKRVGMYWVRH